MFKFRLRGIVSVAIAVSLLSGFANAQHDTGLRIIRQNCMDCHSGDSAEADLNLEKLLRQTPLVKNLKMWRNIAKRIELGDMPPPDDGKLSAVDKKQFSRWYDRQINKFDYQSVADPGYESYRRLTHIEYRHTIRDLFGVDLADISRFPQDLTGKSGFDNSANTLFLQGTLLERYAQSAESVVTKIFTSDSNKLYAKSRQRILAPGSNITDPHRAAKQILNSFASRAFRRPATQREIEQLHKIFRSNYAVKKDIDAAIQKPLVATLVMPQFLFKIENTPGTFKPTRIKHHDLANRLSYFLWASMPDKKLMELANSGKLVEPAVLDAEIDRMLKNRRAKSLGYVFAAQWLGFEDVGVRRRQDPIDNPWCTQTLMDAMKAETALFFYSLIRDNHPVSTMVNARYTYLNEELAKHYQIRGIRGDHMRPVRLKTTRRGGILTHASILCVTAFPDRTSPVVRGKWILDTVLGTPPPEPPPNVSELSERVERRNLSFREKLKLHSSSDRCNSCHREIDPLGFSLENYDNFGRWRTRVDGKRIDAAGQLPNGTKFQGPQGLRKVIVEQRLDDLTRQLAEKMLSYALGRQLEYYDEAAIRKIVATTKADGYRFRTLVKAVIRSYPFQFKRKPEPANDSTK